jgi:hypothetical protein
VGMGQGAVCCSKGKRGSKTTAYRGGSTPQHSSSRVRSGCCVSVCVCGGGGVRCSAKGIAAPNLHRHHQQQQQRAWMASCTCCNIGHHFANNKAIVLMVCLEGAFLSPYQAAAVVTINQTHMCHFGCLLVSACASQLMRPQQQQQQQQQQRQGDSWEKPDADTPCSVECVTQVCVCRQMGCMRTHAC